MISRNFRNESYIYYYYLMPELMIMITIFNQIALHLNSEQKKKIR